MNSSEIRNRFLKFFEKRSHAIIPSASLVPINDPTTLFTGSGMQPMVTYLLGQKHPLGNKLADSQKCFRAVDIEEVGDNRHTTFFEMLGNWSLGDYFKEEQIQWMFEFLTEELKIDPANLYVTTFIGDNKNNIPKDIEAVEFWKSQFLRRGIKAKEVEIGSEEDGYKVGMQGGRIFYYDSKKNWWSRAGIPANMPVGEPGGPDSEMFYQFEEIEHDKKFGEHCHSNCDCGRFLEIGNNVFMEYVKNEDGTFSKLPQKNIDFGGGLERLTMAVNNCADIIEINHKSIIDYLENISGKKYKNNSKESKFFRIVADHTRAAVFLIGDGVIPSNTNQGYFVLTCKYGG
jgi:alanyl-tRNA synthetase